MVSGPSAISSADSIGLSVRSRPWAAMCTVSAVAIADRTAAAVASRAGYSAGTAGSCDLTDFAIGGREPWSGQCDDLRAVARPAVVELSQIAAEGATLTARPANDGSNDHGTDCSAAVGTSTTGRSPTSRAQRAEQLRVQDRRPRRATSPRRARAPPVIGRGEPPDRERQRLGGSGHRRCVAQVGQSGCVARSP